MGLGIKREKVGDILVRDEPLKEIRLGGGIYELYT